MAIKEQCLKCKGYNPSADLCTIKWAQPKYDGQACVEFADLSVPKVVRGHVEEELKVVNPAVKKRGTSHINKSRVVRVESLELNGNDDTDKESPFVLKIPESALREFGLFLFVLLFCGICYGTYWYMNQRQAQKREDLVWKARVELEAVKSERTIEYLKLHNMDYTDGLLTLSFLRNYSKYNVNNQITDSVILKEIVSLVVINPNRWDTICYYLNKAEVDLKIVYSDVLKKPSICIRYSDLSNIILSDEAQKEGIALFTLLKGKEVLGYALKHFSSDRFFRVEGMEMDNENFYLNLSYDDNVAQLGKTFLDTTEVNMHFRDPVGDMGSILDGMLSICTRTNKGFGFTFKGQKSHKIDRVEWSVEKMRKIAEKNISIPYESRKTNQVKTIITRTTSKKIN